MADFGEVRLVISDRATLYRVLAAMLPPGPTRMTLTIPGGDMALTIDSLNGRAYLGFEDRDGNPVDAPDGLVATATSDNTAVLAVAEQVIGTDLNGKIIRVFALTPAGLGTANLSVHSTAAGGGPVLGPDGVTPIPDPAPVAVTVNPGAPASEVFSVTA